MIACLRWWRRASGAGGVGGDGAEVIEAWLGRSAAPDGVVRRRLWLAREPIHGAPGFEVLERVSWSTLAEGAAALDADAPGEPFEARPAAVGAISERCLAAASGALPDEVLLIEVAAPEDVSRALTSRRLARDHWPALLDHAPDLRGAWLRELFPIRPRPVPGVALLELHASGTAGVPAWARRLEALGHRVNASRAVVFDAEPSAASGIESLAQVGR